MQSRNRKRSATEAQLDSGSSARSGRRVKYSQQDLKAIQPANAEEFNAILARDDNTENITVHELAQVRTLVSDPLKDIIHKLLFDPINNGGSRGTDYGNLVAVQECIAEIREERLNASIVSLGKNGERREGATAQ
jgi:hypothetical protein